MSSQAFQVRIRFFAFFLLAAISIFLRLPYVLHHPEGFHKGRQYYDLLISRGIYHQYLNPTTDPWKKNIALIQASRQEALEPPVLQAIVALGYAMAGGEQIWVSRLISVGIWYLGSFAIFCLARRWLGGLGAGIAAAFHMVFPYGLIISTSFLPDVLMVTTFLFALVAIDRFFEDSDSWKKYWISMGVSVAAVWVKPLCLIPLAVIYSILFFSKNSLIQTFKNVRFWLSYLFLSVPVLSHYLIGIIRGDFLQWQFQVSVLPYLLLNPGFWQGWKAMLGLAVGYFPALLSILGIFFLPHARARTTMISYGVGYVFLGLIFTFQIHTHDYYQLVLIPWVCLGTASFICAFKKVGDKRSGRFIKPIFIAFLCVLLLIKTNDKARDIEEMYQYPNFSNLVHQSALIGEKTDHNTRMIYLSSTWGEGKIFQFYGWVAGWEWPSQDLIDYEKIRGISRLDVKDRFQTYLHKGPLDYFVVMDMKEFDLQSDLKSFLNQNFPIFAQAHDFVIYDLRKPLKLL